MVTHDFFCCNIFPDGNDDGNLLWIKLPLRLRDIVRPPMSEYQYQLTIKYHYIISRKF